MAMPLVGLLIIIGWKKATLRDNARICGLTPGLGFRIRIYLAMAMDLLRFVHGWYGSPITTRPRDAAKLEHLRSGPSLFLTAHFHNWELMGAWMTSQGIPLLSVARPMVQGFSQSILIRIRDRRGMKILFEDIPRRALRHVRNGGCFGLLWDQRVPGSKNRAALFGRTLAMDPLPRFLNRHAGLPVYFGVLLPGGSFRILQIASPASAGERPETPSAPIAISDSDEEYRLGRRYHRILECLVRSHPASWYGLTHRRFLQTLS